MTLCDEMPFEKEFRYFNFCAAKVMPGTRGVHAGGTVPLENNAFAACVLEFGYITW